MEGGGRPRVLMEGGGTPRGLMEEGVDQEL